MHMLIFATPYAFLIFYSSCFHVLNGLLYALFAATPVVQAVGTVMDPNLPLFPVESTVGLFAIT